MYLKEAEMPRLEEDIVKLLEQPISREEWNATIKIMKTGKVPGPDGFTLCYYKTFQDILGEPFLEAFNTLQDIPPEYPSMFHAHILVIPKEGKDSQ